MRKSITCALCPAHLFLRSELNSSGWATAPVSADSAEVSKQPRACFGCRVFQCTSKMTHQHTGNFYLRNSLVLFSLELSQMQHSATAGKGLKVFQNAVKLVFTGSISLLASQEMVSYKEQTVAKIQIAMQKPSR